MLACVTGATGIIGSRIVNRLTVKGINVRILSRKKTLLNKGVELVIGDLLDPLTVERFLLDADIVFHCAAELRKESEMILTNIEGTRHLVESLEKNSVSFFCHMSSAGVVGKTSACVVDEKTECHPMNLYEQTKWESEKIVSEKGLENCRTYILRPTNVIDELKIGVLNLPTYPGVVNRIKLLIKGKELAHLIHAEDVADAALFFFENENTPKGTYFVSCDDHPDNTVAGAWKIYRELMGFASAKKILSLPLWVPHVIRRATGNYSNKGNIVYSSQRLLKAGFSFKLGFKGAIRLVALSKRDRSGTTSLPA